MVVTNLNSAEKVPFNLDGRKMMIDPRVEIIHLTLKPEEVLEKHTNPFDVAIYILEGNGIAETDDGSISILPDMCLQISAGVNRGLRNTSSGVLRVLVVKILVK